MPRDSHLNNPFEARPGGECPPGDVACRARVLYDPRRRKEEEERAKTEAMSTLKDDTAPRDACKPHDINCRGKQLIALRDKRTGSKTVRFFVRKCTDDLVADGLCPRSKLGQDINQYVTRTLSRDSRDGAWLPVDLSNGVVYVSGMRPLSNLGANNSVGGPVPLESVVPVVKPRVRATPSHAPSGEASSGLKLLGLPLGLIAAGALAYYLVSNRRRR